MKKSKVTGLFLVFFVLFGLQSGFSQNKQDSISSNKSENVTIYGTSGPVIKRAARINFTPEPYIFKSRNIRPVTRWNSINELPTKISLQPLNPLPVRTYINEKQWNNVFYGGLGSRISPYIEFFHVKSEKNVYRWNLHLYNLSSFKNIKNYLPSSYSTTKAETEVIRYLGFYLLKVKAGYTLNTLHYYGYNTVNDTLTYNKNDAVLKQIYQLGTISLTFASRYRSFDKIQHQIRLSAYSFFDKFGTSENNVTAVFDVHKAFDVTQIFNHQQLGISGRYQFFQNQNRYYVNKNQFISIMPYFDAKYGIFSFTAGAKFEWLQERLTKLHIYPSLKVNINLIPESFSVFGGIKGGLQKQSYRKLVSENPFLSSYNNYFRWQNTRYEIYAGAKGNISKKFGFIIKGGFRYFEDMPFFDYQRHYTFSGPTPFAPDSTTVQIQIKNAFHVSYSGGNMSFVSGGITFHNSKNINLWITGEVNQYNLKNNVKPLYKPAFRLQLGGDLKFSEKLSVWTEAFFVGKRWASHRFFYNPNSASVFPAYYYQLPSYIDINIGATLKLKNNWGSFVKVNNLLNKKYQLFNEYPVEGFQLFLGITYRF